MAENSEEKHQEIDPTDQDPADLVLEVLLARERKGGVQPLSVRDKIIELQRLEGLFDTRVEQSDGEPKYIRGGQFIGAVSASLGQALREGAEADRLERDQKFRRGGSGASRTQPPGTVEPPSTTPPTGPTKK